MTLLAPSVRWPLGIAAILGATMAANLVVLRVASSDPSFAVEPDYYQRAVAWDTTMALARASAALGWRAVADVGPLAPAGPVPVTVTLRTATGAPVTGAAVTVAALFPARANTRLAATLREVAPGRYAAPMPLGTPGRWELRVDAVRARAGAPAPERFSATMRTDVWRAVGR